ncbi:MAG TPA: ATP-binding protein [Desulfosarcina sp.]|nr:ATP-binding protein [Desulfosarcina sp.]
MNQDSAYNRLRKQAERITQNKPVELTETEKFDLLRLTEELELTRIDLEVQNEELRRTSRELEAVSREYFDLYESAPVAYMSIGPTGIIRRANAMARNLLDADPVGRSFSSFVLPEDWGIWFRRLRKTSALTKTFSFDLRLLRRSDRSFIVELNGRFQFSIDGKLEGTQLTFLDVTTDRLKDRQLKKLHDHLNIAAAAARLGIWDYDLRKRTSVWNRELYLLLGLEPAEGPEDGERFFDFIHPDDRKGLLQNLDAFLKGGEDSIKMDFRVVRTDGKVIWMAARGRIYRDGEGLPVRMSGVNYDITARKDAEEQKSLQHLQLARALQETQRLNEDLAQYAYAVSHDLKAPMRAIRNYTDFLIEDLAGGLEEEQKSYLDNLQQAVDQGVQLLDDLLAFSRIGQNPGNKEAVDLDQMVAQLRAVLDPDSRASFRIASPLPTVVCDRTLIRQILQNLLSNALKFNRGSPKQVTVGWRAAPEDSIDLFVTDNGIGIPREHQEKVFGIFQRLHTQSEYAGTGIGLSIVRKAAELLGGTLQLESEPGKGSTFTVRLPRR